jgi:hypothetical protein
MRDIRADLEERASLCEEQIRAAYGQFDQMVQQLQRERDASIADLKSAAATIQRLIDFENHHLGNVVNLPNPSKNPLTLVDRIRAAG